MVVYLTIPASFAVSCMSDTILFLHRLLLHASIAFRLHYMCTLRSAIVSMGGPSKVARDYGFTVQQVCNWAVRGVPARVILDNEDFAQALTNAGYERNKKQAA